MPRPFIRWFPCLLLLVSFGASAIGATTEKPLPPPKDDYYELYKILADTVDQVDRNYVKEVDRRELIEAAIKGVMNRLDPYSTYIGPEELGQFRSTVESEFGGVGIHVSTEDGDLKVLSPIYGTPAYHAGIEAGDQILEINGKSTDGVQPDEAIERMKGKEGTLLSLTILHRGASKPETVSLKRERIHVETVLGERRKPDDTWNFMFDSKSGIAYIRITAFSRETAHELQKALHELKSQQMRGLILDLRFNPGGLLSSAIEISNLFISQGRIVSTKGRNSPERVWDAHRDGAFEGFPMAILVNHYSASASEIVSACLQDHKRAVIIGERTWGKGSVQNIIELEDGRSALKLTTAAYRRPSGKNIHRFPDSKAKDEWGVMPDEGFGLTLGEKETSALLVDRRDRDILRHQHAEVAHAEGPHANASSGDMIATLKPDATTASAKRLTPESAPDASRADASRAVAKSTGDSKIIAKRPVEKNIGEKKPFVDRQFEMALKYLNDELAHEKKPGS